MDGIEGTADADGQMCCSLGCDSELMKGLPASLTQNKKDKRLKFIADIKSFVDYHNREKSQPHRSLPFGLLLLVKSVSVCGSSGCGEQHLSEVAPGDLPWSTSAPEGATTAVRFSSFQALPCADKVFPR